MTTTTQEPLAALRAGDKLDFLLNKKPVCPHCGHASSVVDQEWFHLYQEGLHEVTCPSCDLDFKVSTMAVFKFSTNRQDGTTDD